MFSPHCHPVPSLTTKDIERFWSKIDKRGRNQCWPWVAKSVGRGGYGVLSVGPAISRRLYRAPRIAYFLNTGQYSDRLCVCHRCDNPACCNPAHLFIATHGENLIDMRRKGRGAKGEQVGSARLTATQVLEIRARHSNGGISIRRLAMEYGVDPVTIFFIVHRKNWRHVV